MSKLTKRLLSGLLSFVMVLSMVVLPSFTVTAADSGIVADIPTAHVVKELDYTAFYTAGNNTVHVTDPDANGGKAARNTSDATHVYIAFSSGAGGAIGTLQYADMSSDYQIYKFTYAVPSGTTSAMVFLMNNWQFQSSELGSALAAYAGQTIEVYFSMKVTGPDANNYYTTYVDRVAIATLCSFTNYVDNGDGTFTATCDTEGCGKTKTTVNAIDVIPAAHLEKELSYTAFYENNGNNTVWVQDSDAHGGKAASNTSDAQSLVITHNGGGGLIGNLSCAELASKSGYQVYKFTYDVPAGTTSAMVFLMENWEFQSITLGSALAAYAGQTVEVYFSIKVVDNSNGTYTTYVDRVAIATLCSFTNYVDNGDGTETATCDAAGCTQTHTKMVGTLDLSVMQIVLPAAPTAVERTAAAELRTYVEKITGVKLAIKAEGSNSGAGIYIGATAQATLKGVSYPTEGDENGEAWTIKAVDGDLFLCGAPTRGPLYAVYHLLEDVLSVRWWNMWEEDVPTGDAIVAEDYADSGVPAMKYRDIYVNYWGNTDYTYYARNRINGNFSFIPDTYGDNEVYGYAHVHTFDKYFTPDDLTAHPEWFPLIDGTRVFSGQLCLTNSSLKAEFTTRLLGSVANDPDAMYSVSPGDTTAFCQCDSCQSEINTYGMSGYVLRFVNEMAAAVTDAGYTEAKVEMLVYWVYLDPPTGGVTPASNVHLRYADNYVDLLHGLDHANNADTVEKLQRWMDIANNDNIYYWQYVVNYTENGILPSMFHYGDDMTMLEEMGVNGWFAEQEQCINGDFWDMKLWLIAKLMENPVSGEEYEALMDEFIYGYYGEEAGKYIRDYLYHMHKKAEISNAYYDFGTIIIGADWLAVSDIIAGHNYFEQAFAAAEDATDATLLRRLRAARLGLDRVIYQNFNKWKTQAEAAGLTLPFTRREVGERIYQTLTEQIEMRGSYDTDYPKFYSQYDRYSNDQAELPDQLDGVAKEHALVYTTEDFRVADFDYNGIVEDTDSIYGTAFRCDTAGNSDLKVSSFRNNIGMYLYDPDGAGTVSIGSLSFSNVKPYVNQGYHLYEFSWTVPTMADSGYIFILDDWGLQLDSMKKDLKLLAGQTVKIYLSMKITGTVSSLMFSGSPVYYIDAVYVLPYPDQPAHNYVTTPSAYTDTCRSVCSACGDVVLTPHEWNDGVITEAPTFWEEGQKNYTCTVCGGTKTETLDKLIPTSFIDLIRPGHLASTRVYSAFNLETGTTTYVDDAEAYGGKAVCNTSAAACVEILHYNTSTGDAQKIGELDFAEMASKAGYQVYKFTYEVPAEAASRDLFWILQNWQLNSSTIAADLAANTGKTVELYLSIKVEDDGDGTYTTYVDRVAIATLCSFTNYVSNNDASFTANATETAVCDNGCGATDTREIPDSMLAVNPAAHVEYEGAYNTFAEVTPMIDPDTGDTVSGRTFATLPALDVNHTTQGHIGDVPADQLKVNDGYHVYKFIFTVPEEATGGYVFLTGNWTPQHFAIGKAMANYPGQTVELYFSIKITGNDTDGYVMYLNQAVLATACDSCSDYDICRTCGQSTHSFVTVNVVEPTCNNAGTKTYTCGTCGDTKTEVMDALGHTVVTDAAVDATCTETGLTEGCHCSVCNEVLVTQEEVAALDHSYVGNVCERCGDVQAPAGITISGTIKSYGDAAGEVTVTLLNGETEVATVTSTDGTYSLLAPAAGTYTLTVAKANHVTRTYEITVADTAITQDVEIHLIGDVNGNGSVTITDVNRVYAHVKQTKLLTDYELLCADVNGAGGVTITDVNRMYAHVKQTKLLW